MKTFYLTGSLESGSSLRVEYTINAKQDEKEAFTGISIDTEQGTVKNYTPLFMIISPMNETS